MKKGVESFGRKVLEGKDGAGRLVEGALGVAKVRSRSPPTRFPSFSLSLPLVSSISCSSHFADSYTSRV